MRYSLRINNDLPTATVVALARAAEAAGFHQLWVSHDLFLRSAPALLGAVAASTSTIHLGIAVTNPYSAHPVELAMSAATLQEVSGGRFLLGVGAGSAEFLGWAGLPRPRPLATTAQAVVVLRTLLGHDDADPALLPDWYGGDGRLKFAVPTPVPVYVGGMGPKMLDLAGRYADGALPLLYPPEHYAAARDQVTAGLHAAGRDPDRFDLAACFWVSTGGDGDAARDALAEKLAYYGPSISPYLLRTVGLRPEDFGPAAALAQRGLPSAALVDERMLSLGVAGDPGDVVTRCRSLLGLGARHLSFGPPLGPDPVAAVEVLGTDVLPALAVGEPV